jgi:ubiquinone/menaquinone biosynthesis C-methylase UbiE
MRFLDKSFFAFGWLFLFVLETNISISQAFSVDPSKKGDAVKDASRRDLLVWPIGVGGAVLYGKLVSDAFQKLSRGELVYPDAHEQRVETTIATAVVGAIPRNTETVESSVTLERPLRILEVGVGKDCRVARRDLYRKAFSEVASSQTCTKIELTGLDIVSPSENVLDITRDFVRDLGIEYNIEANFNYRQGSVTEQLEFEDGHFDCVLSILTLCSVDDQLAALKEMKRVLRPHGGTFGYVEHTAVLADEPYRLLEFQQIIFDPLQQAVADNCHLHRYTDATVSEVFGPGSRRLTTERFIVDGMWPVSCQSSGVFQRYDIS